MDWSLATKTMIKIQDLKFFFAYLTKHQINMPSLKQVLKKMKPCVTCNFWNTKVNENQRQNIQADDKIENKTN